MVLKIKPFGDIRGEDYFLENKEKHQTEIRDEFLWFLGTAQICALLLKKKS